MTTPTTPDMSGVRNMADIGRVLKEQLVDGSKATPSPQPPPQDGGKAPESESGTRVPVKTEGLSAEELALIKPPKAAKSPEEGQPKTIAGTPYTSLEALADGYKNLQRRFQEVQDEAKHGIDDKARRIAREELARMLAEVPEPKPQESEEEKALKTEDPDAYRMLQQDKKIDGLNGQIEKLVETINELRRQEQVKEIQSDFRQQAERVKVPLNILMAYASLPQYAKQDPVAVADEVKELWEAEIRKYAPELKPAAPAPAPAPAGEIRSPASGGAPGIINEPLTVADIGIPGSKQFRESTHKIMAQLFARRHQGGGA